MFKIFIAIFFTSSLAIAQLVNAIALIVNDKAITLYDIEYTSKINNIDKNSAVSLLIDNILYEQLVKKHNIQADIFDVNNYIEKLANQNRMDVYTFKSLIKQKYPDYSKFEEEIKKTIIKDKLLKKIIKGNINIASENDIKLYYEKNKEKFTSAKNFYVTKYTSKSKKSLLEVAKNPLILNNNVQKEDIILQSEQLSPQLKYLLNGTSPNKFTPIFTANKEFNLLYIIKKEGLIISNYEDVKQKVFNDIMALREKKYLKDFFEKEKLTADIKIIR